MKKLSILLVLIMLSTLLLPAFAEEAQGPTEKEILEMPCDFALIEADEAIGQPRLTYIEGVTPILTVDGLKFKDLNKNGALDVYEDWRKDTEERVWDLIAQLTPEEEAGLHFCVSANLNTARAMIPDFKNNCMLFNLNGSPVAVTNTLNNLQATGEAERLGIPMTFTSDRAYNAFGGYIDMPHIAFGTANDPELAYKLSYIYGECMVAVGVHVTFEPYRPGRLRLRQLREALDRPRRRRFLRAFPLRGAEHRQLDGGLGSRAVRRQRVGHDQLRRRGLLQHR